MKNNTILTFTSWFHTVSRKIYNPEAFLNFKQDNNSLYVRARYGQSTPSGSKLPIKFIHIFNIFTLFFSKLQVLRLSKGRSKGRLQKKKSKTWDIVPSSDTPSPPSELGTSLCEIFLTGFLRLVYVPLCLIQRDLLSKAILIKITLLSQVVKKIISYKYNPM